MVDPILKSFCIVFPHLTWRICITGNAQRNIIFFFYLINTSDLSTKNVSYFTLKLGFTFSSLFDFYYWKKVSHPSLSPSTRPSMFTAYQVLDYRDKISRWNAQTFSFSNHLFDSNQDTTPTFPFQPGDMIFQCDRGCSNIPLYTDRL